MLCTVKSYYVSHHHRAGVYESFWRDDDGKKTEEVSTAILVAVAVRVGRKTSEFNFTSETFHSLAFVLPSHRLLMLKVGFFGLGILFLWLKYFIIFANFSSIVRKSVCVCGTRVVFNLNINLYMFTEYIHCKSNEYKLVMKIRALNAALNCKNANHQLQFEHSSFFMVDCTRKRTWSHFAFAASKEKIQFYYKGKLIMMRERESEMDIRAHNSIFFHWTANKT